MYRSATLFLVFLSVAFSSAHFFRFGKLEKYSRFFGTGNVTGNDLWQGLIKDCRKKVTFSCIQKNAYSYLDDVFMEPNNVTFFGGVTLTKNNLDYENCAKEHPEDNLVEVEDEHENEKKNANCDKDEEEHAREYVSPLEEITSALRKKAMKFLATRDYQVQLPEYFFQGASMKISPREIDENGALIRVDFGEGELESQGRLFFKKISKHITHTNCSLFTHTVQLLNR